MIEEEKVAEKKWVEKIFPGIYIIGNDASDTGGNQSILIEKDNHIYLISTGGFDYGSWVEKWYELTPREKEQVMNWKDSSYDLSEWLKGRKANDSTIL